MPSTISKIDAALYQLYLQTPPGQTLTYCEIADGCRCSKDLIRHIERKAVRKVRRRLQRIAPELFGDDNPGDAR